MRRFLLHRGACQSSASIQASDFFWVEIPDQIPDQIWIEIWISMEKTLCTAYFVVLRPSDSQINAPEHQAQLWRRGRHAAAFYSMLGSGSMLQGV